MPQIGIITVTRLIHWDVVRKSGKMLHSIIWRIRIVVIGPDSLSMGSRITFPFQTSFEPLSLFGYPVFKSRHSRGRHGVHVDMQIIHPSNCAVVLSLSALQPAA